MPNNKLSYAHFGVVSEKPVDWRRKPAESDPDDNEHKTPKDVKMMLGFDPAKYKHETKAHKIIAKNNKEWWESLSLPQQKQYIKDHPKTKYKITKAPSTKQKQKTETKPDDPAPKSDGIPNHPINNNHLDIFKNLQDILGLWDSPFSKVRFGHNNIKFENLTTDQIKNIRKYYSDDNTILKLYEDKNIAKINFINPDNSEKIEKQNNKITNDIFKLYMKHRTELYKKYPAAIVYDLQQADLSSRQHLSKYVDDDVLNKIQLSNELSDEQRIVINNYTGGENNIINSALRTDNNLSKQYADKNKHIKQAIISSKVTKDTHVWRGIPDHIANQYSKYYNEHKDNTVILNNAYLSTSRSASVASGFGGGQDILKIKLPKNSNALSVEEFSEFPKEHEILLEASNHLKLHKVHELVEEFEGETYKYRLFEMELIPYPKETDMVVEGNYQW